LAIKVAPVIGKEKQSAPASKKREDKTRRGKTELGFVVVAGCIKHE